MPIPGSMAANIQAVRYLENAGLQGIKDKQGIEYTTEKQYRRRWRRNNKINEFMNRSMDCVVKHRIANNKIGHVLIGELKSLI